MKDSPADDATPQPRTDGPCAPGPAGGAREDAPAPGDEEGGDEEGGDEAPGEEGGEPDPLRRPEPDGARIATIKPLAHRIEALVFASAQPLSTARLAKLLQASREELAPALQALREAWSQRPGAIELVEIAGGWRFMTRPAFHDDLLALSTRKGTDRLSPAALETLAVVAYRQPITREDVEGIRGVQSGPLLRALLERDLIRIKGRSKTPGHPLLYGTTRRFLDHFGLESLKSLPDIEDLLET